MGTGETTREKIERNVANEKKIRREKTREIAKRGRERREAMRSERKK